MDFPQERFIETDSVWPRYYAEGEGSAVVLIHGLGGSTCSWLPSISDR